MPIRRRAPPENTHNGHDLQRDEANRQKYPVPKADQIIKSLEGELEQYYPDDTIRREEMHRTEQEMRAVMEEIQRLAEQRYALDKKINHLSIRLNRLEKHRVNLTLPFYEHK